MSADGTLAIDARLATTGDWHINHSLISSPDSIELYDWKAIDRFCVSSQLAPVCKIQILPRHNDKGEQETRGFFGYATNRADKSSPLKSFFSEVQVQPAALVHIAHKPTTKTALHDGILTLTDDAGEIQIDASTGAILSLKGASFLSAGISAVDIRSEKGLASKLVSRIRRRGAKFANRYNDDQPYASAISYALAQLQRQPAVKEYSWRRAILHLATAAADDKQVRNALSARLTRDATKDSDQFTIPGAPEFAVERWREYVSFYTPLIVDKLFPRGSWVWALAREWTFGKLHPDERYDKYQDMRAKEIARITTADDYGPISCLLAAHVCNLLSTTSSTSRSEDADEGLGKIFEAAFLKDIQYVTDGDCGFPAACRAVAKSCGDLSEEELDGLQELLPPAVADVFGKLVARRKEKPDEAPADSIRTAMLDAWHNGLKHRVEADLRSMSTTPAVAAEKKSQPK